MQTISHFLPPNEIIHILSNDPQAETHELIAQALKDNYASFTGYSFWGIQLISDKHARKEYASILKNLKPEYQTAMLHPIVKNIEAYNVIHLLYYASAQHKQVILEALEHSAAIDLSLYSGTEIFHLLTLTKPLNQRIVAQAIAKNVSTYTSWHFQGMFKLCTEEK